MIFILINITSYFSYRQKKEREKREEELMRIAEGFPHIDVDHGK